MGAHIFKFGGASIRNAEAIRQMADIVESQLKSASSRLVIVVSAMGKTTNKLELVAKYWFQSDRVRTLETLTSCIDDHKKILNDLRVDECKAFDTFTQELRSILDTHPTETFNYHYDQIVAFGELFSSSIIHQYLRRYVVELTWMDARKLIRTSDDYRFANVDWGTTMHNIKESTSADSSTIITQGFLGGYESTTTTLGREGSDYSAAIFGCALAAKEVIFWKDVPGVMNMDPKLSNEATLYSHLPYKEAAEMTYYGAQIIHPKTIKPLENHGIQLRVKPFTRPGEDGTMIGNVGIKPAIPAIIFKDDLCLLSFQLPDFEFVNEKHLTSIIGELSSLNINIYMMQNSAISISLVIDQDSERIDALMRHFGDEFSIRYNTDLSLRTVKNYTTEILNKNIVSGEVFLEQTSRFNHRVLFRRSAQ